MNYQPPRKLPNKFALELHYVKKLTWLQRLQFAIGYNARLRVKLLVDKRSGEVRENVTLTTTKELVTRSLQPCDLPNL
jgi:hypothetical protein